LDADAIEARAKQAAVDALSSPQAAAAAAGEGDGGSVAELQAECKRLRETVGQVREDGRRAEASAEAMRRQAENLSREYTKLMAQKESLENRLADFELLMGPQVKKAK
jgi:chromosome segregation ATPase